MALGAFIPIQTACFAIQLRRVICERFVLRNTRRIAGGKHTQRFEQRFRRDLCELIVQRRTRLGRQDVDLALKQNVAGIEAFIM